MRSFFKLVTLVMASSLCIQAFASELKSDASNAEKMVVDFYQQVFVNRADVKEIAEKYVHPDYIQHNPYVATGREAFIKAVGGWMANAPETARWEIKRVIADGDYIVLHVHSFDTSKKSPGRAGVDIFRVENGLIMEHWDVWQDIPENMPHDNGML